MKKLRCLLITALGVILAITLSGCGQSEEAKAMDAQIMEIGEVSLDSVEAIKAAEDAYSALDEQDQKQVKKYKELVEARNAYSELRAADVIKAIDQIGSVDTGSLVRKRINQAEKRFLSLTEAEQALVTNAALLEQAKADYDAACAKEVEQQIEQVGADIAQIKKIEAAYKELTPSQRDLVKNYSKLTDMKIAYVTASIDAIGEVTLDSAETVEAAEKAYQSLSVDERKLVTNASMLETAKDTLVTLQEEKRKADLEALLNRVKKKRDDVSQITWYLSTAEPKYSNSRSYMLPYLGKNDSGLLFVRLVYNYAGRDWIFFDNATIVTDTMRYTRTFNYFDINRETAFGANLSERLDIVADSNDIKMLRDMAGSAKATVRLQGDHYNKDITLEASDKQAISDILALYDLLSEEEGVVAVS